MSKNNITLTQLNYKLQWYIISWQFHPSFSDIRFVCLLRYNIEQEQKLALETTVLVEQYTVSEQEVDIVSSLLDGSIKII